MSRLTLVLLSIFILSTSTWVYLVFNKEISDRVEENKPRDWKQFCSDNPKHKHCWGGDKAPWLGGPFCHNIRRTEKNQAPGTAVRCR